jgi:DNA polymerase-1
MLKRSWEYVVDKEGLRAARKDTYRYLNQDAGKEAPLLALDCETFRPDRNRAKFPRAIMDGGQPQGKMRLFQVGFDACRTDLLIRDKQYLIDVPRIGQEYVCAAFKEIVQECTALGQNIRYDLGFIEDMFGVIPQWNIDTMYISQVLKAGDRINHSLGDLYEHHLRYKAPGLFEELTGMSFEQYKEYKKLMQNAPWFPEIELPRKQLQYAADDVRLLFYVYHQQLREIDRWTEVYERNLKDGEGIREILQLEFSLIPLYTQMEKYGIKFDAEHHKNNVIPLMERKRDEALRECAQYSGLCKDSSKRYVIFNRPDEKIDTKHVAGAKHIANSIYPGLVFTIEKRATKSLNEVVFSWINGPDESAVAPLLCMALSNENGYTLNSSTVINLTSTDQLGPALERMGFEIPKELKVIKDKKTGQPKVDKNGKVRKKLQYACDEEVLQGLIDPDNDDDPMYDPIRSILKFRKAASYASKYGRGLLEFVTKDGYIHPQWNQLGSEHNEIVSGRTSCGKPGLMQMASREDMYAGDDDQVKSSELTRSQWQAEEGCTLIVADKASIEPRTICEFSGDKALQSIFHNKVDQYGLVAQKLFKLDHIPTKECKCKDKGCKMKRALGKTAQLGSFYGAGAPTYAAKARILSKGKVRLDKETAKQHISDLWELHAGVKEMIDKTEQKVTKRLRQAGSLAAFKGRRPFGVVQTKMGRPRRFCLTPEQEKMPDHILKATYRGPNDNPYFYSEYKRRLNEVRRAAFNHRIQGSCADMLKLAEIFLWNAIKARGWNPRLNRIIIVMHDEIVLQVENENLIEGKVLMWRCMHKAMHTFIKKTPVSISLGVGRNWHEGGDKAHENYEPSEEELQISKMRYGRRSNNSSASSGSDRRVLLRDISSDKKVRRNQEQKAC